VLFALLEIEYSLAQAAIGAGASPRSVLRELQDHWNLPRADPYFAKARDDDEPTMPGDHPITEIGRQEKAFFMALTRDQQDAYRAVAAMVNDLYRKGKGWAGVDPFSAELSEPIDEWKRRAFLALATQPMAAYMLGQTLTQEALKAGIARPLYPTDREAIAFLEHYTFNEIGTAFDRFKGELRAKLIEGMQQGSSPEEVARDLAKTFADNKSDFALLTITENTRAESQGRLQELKDSGYEYAIGSSAHDSRTCDSCLELIDGKVVKVSDTVGRSNFGRKRAEWLPVIPCHPRCRCLWLPYFPETATIVRDATKQAAAEAAAAKTR